MLSGGSGCKLYYTDSIGFSLEYTGCCVAFMVLTYGLSCESAEHVSDIHIGVLRAIERVDIYNTGTMEYDNRNI